MDRIHRVLFWIVVGGWVITLLFVFLPNWIQNQLPVIDYHTVEFIDKTAKPGGKARVRMDRTIGRLCGRGRISENWRQDNIWKDRRIRPAAGSPKKIGRNTFEFPLHIPEDLTPGEWCYEPAITYSCDGVAHTYEQPPICIEVQ